MFGRKNDPNLAAARQLRNQATGNLKTALTSYITNVQKLNTTVRNNRTAYNSPYNAYAVPIKKAVANLVFASRKSLSAAVNALKAKEEAAQAKAAANAARAAAKVKAAANATAAQQKAAANKAAAASAAQVKAAANAEAARAAAVNALRANTITISQLNSILSKLPQNANSLEMAWKSTRRSPTESNEKLLNKARANLQVNMSRTFGNAKYRPLWVKLLGENAVPKNKKTALKAAQNAAMARIQKVFNTPYVQGAYNMGSVGANITKASWRAPPYGKSESFIAVSRYTNGRTVEQIKKNIKNVLAGAPAFKPGSDLDKFFRLALIRRKINNNQAKLIQPTNLGQSSSTLPGAASAGPTQP